MVPFLLLKASVANSACGNFCWNYVTDVTNYVTFYNYYVGDNICCNYADFEVLLQLCW